MRSAHAGLLSCPHCHRDLELTVRGAALDDILDATLSCVGCARTYVLSDGVLGPRDRHAPPAAGLASSGDADRQRDFVLLAALTGVDPGFYRKVFFSDVFAFEASAADAANVDLAAIAGARVLAIGRAAARYLPLVAEGADLAVGVVDAAAIPELRARTRHMSNVLVVEGDVADAPLRSGAFDWLYALDAPASSSGLRHLVDRAVQVLKPGGRISLHSPVGASTPMPSTQRLPSGGDLEDTLLHACIDAGLVQVTALPVRASAIATKAAAGATLPQHPSARIVACIDGPPDQQSVRSGDDVTVQGWAFDVSGFSVRIDVLVDGDPVLELGCDAARSDVKQAFPDVPHALCTGFEGRVRVRRAWAPKVTLTLHARSATAEPVVIGERELHVQRRTLVKQAAHAFRRRHPALTERLLRRWRPQAIAPVPADAEAEMARYRRWIALYEAGVPHPHRCNAGDPVISIVLPVHETPPAFLHELLASIAAQTCPRWQLCAVDDGSPTRTAWRILETFAAEHPGKVALGRRDTAGGIAVASNEAMALATGEFMVYCDHDDTLRIDAIAVLAEAIRQDPAVDVLYSDYDILEPDGRRADPRLKPGWSPDLLRAYMYWGHVKCYRVALVRKLGGLRPEFRGGEDYDLALRISEVTQRIVHVPQVLYHWRRHPQSTSSGGLQKQYSIESGVRAINEHLARTHVDAQASWPEASRRAGVGLFRLDFRFDNLPKVAIVVPTRDRLPLLARCISTLDDITEYAAREIIIVDNDSVEPETLEYLRNTRHRVLRAPGAFNFSAMMNAAARATDADYLLLLNNDTEIVQPDWLKRMVGFGRMPGVGAVGAKLLYPDGRIQHLGVVMGHEGLTGHYFQGEASPAGDFGYLSYKCAVRNVAAVTAACMLTPRALYLEVGGFDEGDLAVAWNDVDYCLRLLRRGYRMVVDPDVVLIHHEGVSRGEAKNEHEIATMFARWRDVIEADPYYHPGFALTGRSFNLRLEPAEAEFARLYYAPYAKAVRRAVSAAPVAADAD